MGPVMDGWADTGVFGRVEGAGIPILEAVTDVVVSLSLRVKRDDPSLPGLTRMPTDGYPADFFPCFLSFSWEEE
jgi:hypothetical protein